MRIGMRLLLGYFLLVAVAAWFVLAIFVKEVKPGVRRATEGTLIDTATLLAELAWSVWCAQHVAKSCRSRKFGDVCCRADYGRLAAYWRFERRQTERGDGSGH